MSSRVLFGGSEPWPAFTAVDDRIRGGSSISHFTVGADNLGRFHGHLDITTLGGAGFASQSATFTPRLCLSPAHSSGLLLTFIPPTPPPASQRNTLSLLPAHAPHKFVLLLKNEKPKKMEDGRRQSVVVYEWVLDVKDYAEYALTEQSGGREAEKGDEEKLLGKEKKEVTVLAKWDEFKPHYRGKAKDDAPPLNPASIYELGFMCRSNFGEQAGDFELEVISLAEALRDKQLERAYRWAQVLIQWLGEWKLWFLELVGLSGQRGGTVRLP
ncbi:hypothetical protein JCM11251_004707 [Rhodosporidiobolus azoricus]